MLRLAALVQRAGAGVTLAGTVGLVVMLALAVPAFRETSDDDWLKIRAGGHLPDRYGNEVGRAHPP